MSEIQIIDNYLHKTDYLSILKFVTGKNMPWAYGNILSPEKNKQDKFVWPEHIDWKYNYQHFHVVYDKLYISNYYNEIAGKIIFTLNPDALLRIKLNMNQCTDSIIVHGFHTDNQIKNSKTAIYYLNDNDGYTSFENGEKVESISNRLVIFPTYIKHAGSTCTNTNARIVLNINYFKE